MQEPPETGHPWPTAAHQSKGSDRAVFHRVAWHLFSVRAASMNAPRMCFDIMQCNAMQSNAIQCNDMFFNATQCSNNKDPPTTCSLAMTACVLDNQPKIGERVRKHRPPSISSRDKSPLKCLALSWFSYNPSLNLAVSCQTLLHIMQWRLSISEHLLSPVSLCNINGLVGGSWLRGPLEMGALVLHQRVR